MNKTQETQEAQETQDLKYNDGQTIKIGDSVITTFQNLSVVDNEKFIGEVVEINIEENIVFIQNSFLKEPNTNFFSLFNPEQLKRIEKPKEIEK